MPSSTSIIKYIDKYHNKAAVVRQIHSNIAESKRKWDIRHTVITIVLGAIFTFTGFMGTDRIFDTVFTDTRTEADSRLPVNASLAKPGLSHDPRSLKVDTVTAKESETAASLYAKEASNNEDSKKSTMSRKVFDLVFNGAALLLFIASILNLIYRWKDEHTVHFQGVVKLTAYLNWLEELSVVGVKDDDIYLVKEVRSRYQAIVEALPPNDEKDYRKAKKSLERKEQNNRHTPNEILHPSGSDARDFNLVRGLVQESSVLMAVLIEARNTDHRLWLGGGQFAIIFGIN
jgi:hypothetical protein